MLDHLNKGTPGSFHTGYNDLSSTVIPTTPDANPVHFPVFCAFAERGSPATTAGSISDHQGTLGAKTFDVTEKYWNHQIDLAKVIGGYGNDFFFKRLIPHDARKATVVFWCEIVTKTFKEYGRINGQVTTEPDGSLSVTETDFVGNLIRWSATVLPDSEAGNLKNLAPKANTGLVGDGEESVAYPIAAAHISSAGEFGSRTGLRMWMPHARQAEPGNVDLMTDLNELLLRVQLVEAPTVDGTAAIINTAVANVPYVDIAMRNGIIESGFGYDPSKVVDSYNDKSASPVVTGNVGGFYVYEDNVNLIQSRISAREETTASDFYKPGIINFFSGVDPQGNDHYSIRFSEDSLNFTTTDTHYFLEGSDGDTSIDNFNTMFKAQMTSSWEEPGDEWLDRLRFPFSEIYDSGFPLDVTETIIDAVGKRPDIGVTVATQDLAKADMTLAEEIAIGEYLTLRARLHPESSIFGTANCRVTIVGHVCERNQFDGTNDQNHFSAVVDFARMRAEFMGQSNGYLKAGLGYDLPDNNRVKIVESVTNTYGGVTANDALFANGVNYIRYSGRSALHWPAAQTAYALETSILNSDMVVRIMIALSKIGDYMWTRLTGSLETDSVFIQRAQAEFEELTRGRYDGKIISIPEFYFTPDDTIRGFSWHLNIKVYGSVAKSVQTETLTAYRLSDLGNT